MKSIKLLAVTLLALFSLTIAGAQPKHRHKKHTHAHHKQNAHHHGKTGHRQHKAKHGHGAHHKK